MIHMNRHYSDLKESYLFFRIAEKIREYQRMHPGKSLLRMGIGDVSLPLCPAVITALHEAVAMQGEKKTFHGYVSETGDPLLRAAIARHYQKRGVDIREEEVFVSSGASDELGDLLDLFDASSPAMIIEPAYPAYVDASVIAGREILFVSAKEENHFLPLPIETLDPGIIYLCSPNNPTGAAMDRPTLQRWVDYANGKDAVILYDAAYEAFISDPSIPHSIFEFPGARTCAIEICSLSKTAGFTGTRCGYTIIPKELEREGMNLSKMWTRNRTTKTNGVSFVIQRGALAVFTEEGQKEIQETLSVYRANGRVFTEALDALGVYYTGGKNAPYIWVKCPEGTGSWEVFDELLEEAQIVCTPGQGFGESGEGYIRFSMFADPDDTIEAARRLKALWKK
ncbi:MAG: LL-diaminopimelate aminotransferase [Solobacterium sp.]|nr:LL-diaminopimelate aminotransferase [Solobacterium sp.]